VSRIAIESMGSAGAACPSTHTRSRAIGRAQPCLENVVKTEIEPVTREPRPVGIVERIGLLSFRRRGLVLMLWPVLLVALFGLSSMVGEEFRQTFALPGSETEAAAQRLADAGFEGRGGQQGMLVVRSDTGVDSAAVRGSLEGFLQALSEVDGLVVSSHLDAPAGAQVSEDGSIAYSFLDFGDVSFTDAQSSADEVVALAARQSFPAELQVEFAGDMFAEEVEFSTEAVGLLAAALILLIAFGSVLAMGLPIATALVGIGCGVAMVTIATAWIDIPPFAPGTVAMIGIGVGIDYALFIVTRYREELATGLSPEQAVGRTMATAGKSTVFAGATVVTSLLGLLVIGLDDVRSLALAAGAGVLFVMAASVTLLPALLGVVGRRIDRLGLPYRLRRAPADITRSPWYRWSRVLQRRPALTATAAVLVLLVLAAPVTGMRLGLTDASVRPETDTTRVAHDLINEGFGPGATAPLLLALSLPEGAADPESIVDGLVTTLADVEGVALAVPAPGATVTGAMVIVLPDTPVSDPATGELVQALRSDVLPATLAGTGADALVGGRAAAAVDFADHNAAVLPWFIGVVLTLAFLLLVVLFRSLFVPLKAIVVNLLSVGAAYGAVVAVFQWGWLGDVFRLGEPGPIEAWVPMILFAIVFGLSIDYEVFLLSRIRERFNATGDNSRAIAEGLARSARLIAAAAAIMVCVFAVFAFSADRPLQMLGLGLAVGIAVDATVVRLLLVPAMMELLGDRNWWLPGWLDRLLPARR
jgi:putative drug exporter of the RND superfamily